MASKMTLAQAVQAAKNITFDGLRAQSGWRTRKPVVPLEKWTIWKGDQVQVVSGEFEGQKGRIKKVFRKRNLVIVENVNVRSTSVEGQQQETGESTSAQTRYEQPIDVHCVKILDPRDKKPTDVRMEKVGKFNRRWSMRTGTKIPFAKQYVDAYKAEKPKKAGPYDTIASVVQAKTYDITDPWNYPFPKELRM